MNDKLAHLRSDWDLDFSKEVQKHKSMQQRRPGNNVFCWVASWLVDKPTYIDWWSDCINRATHIKRISTYIVLPTRTGLCLRSNNCWALIAHFVLMKPSYANCYQNLLQPATVPPTNAPPQRVFPWWRQRLPSLHGPALLYKESKIPAKHGTHKYITLQQ